MIHSFNKIDHEIFGFHDDLMEVLAIIFEEDTPRLNLASIPKDFAGLMKNAKGSLGNPLKEIAKHYHQLNTQQKNKVKEALQANNDVACFGDPTLKLVRYNDLEKDFAGLLKKFFNGLWDGYLKTKGFITNYKNVLDHYENLIKQNNVQYIICPFCGLNKFKPPGDKYREAYDHLLPKAIYPFIAVNFNMLFPTCNSCNSDEKRDKDILYNEDGTRRKTFDPYDPGLTFSGLKIKVDTNRPPVQALDRLQWDCNISRDGDHQEELHTWDYVYGIKRRYKKDMENLERTWFDLVLNKYKRNLENGISFGQFKSDILADARDEALSVAGGVLKKTYLHYLMHQEHIEQKLNYCIRTN